MTSLLSEAIKEVEKLPPEIQNEIAGQLMEDIENEIQWQSTLSKPQEKLDKLAQEALKKSRLKKTKKMGFDEL